jgi:hypothetical membrane protein
MSSRTGPAPQQASLLWAGLVQIAGGLLYPLAEAVTAAAWTVPPYSYSYNWVSELGVPQPTIFLGHHINSPLHAVMNGAFLAQGALFLVAAALLARALHGVRTRRYLVLAALHAFGMLLVGSFPETSPLPGMALHFLGAGLALVCGNLAIHQAGTVVLAGIMPGWFARFSRLCGLIGLAALTFLAVFTPLAFNLVDAIGGGLIERLAVYPLVAWSLVSGCLLLRVARAEDGVSES